MEPRKGILSLLHPRGTPLRWKSRVESEVQKPFLEAVKSACRKSLLTRGRLEEKFEQELTMGTGTEALWGVWR